MSDTQKGIHKFPEIIKDQSGKPCVPGETVTLKALANLIFYREEVEFGVLTSILSKKVMEEG